MKASESSQKYKEGKQELLRFGCGELTVDQGKFLLEREKIIKDNAWTVDDE